MKKTVLLLGALMISAGAFAWSEWVDGVRWYYDLTGAGATIQTDPGYQGGNYCGDLTTPKELGGKGSTVVGIEAWAFFDCTNLTSLVVSETVESIGEYAFGGCCALTNLTLPSSLTSIGTNVFEGCGALVKIRVEAGEAKRMRELVAATGADVSGIEFVEPYVIAFDAQGGVPPPEPLIREEGAAYGELPTVARTGYQFAGWFTARKGGEKISADTKVVSNVTYYAQWNANTYDVGFNGRGGEGEMDPQPMTYDQDVALVSNEFHRVGYAFLGWTDDEAELEEVLYEDGVVVSNLTDVAEGSVDLYAVWQANAYAVKFNANGGEGEATPQTFLYDQAQALTANGFSREGFAFDHWANATGQVFYDGAVVSNLTSVADGEVELFAVWRAGDNVVTFDACGGEATTKTRTVKTKDPVGELPTAERTGCVFAGWFTAAVGGAQVTAETVVTADVTYYAQWENVPYKLTAKPNSTKYGSVSGSGTYDYGTEVTLTAKAKSGYVFAGWYTDSKYTKKLNPEGYDNRKASIKYAMPAKATTVYAKFITKSSDKSALKFTSATKKLATTATSFAAGKAMTAITVKASSASLPTLSMKGLPSGMTFDPATGKITGTPTKPGKYAATVTVKSAAGNSVSQKVKIYVTAPSGYYGTFGGYALVKTTPAYITFTSDKYGAVSGKVTYKGKGYSFKTSYSSSSPTRSKFTPSIKIGSIAYKPVTYVERVTDGITVSEARGEQVDKFVFVAQKKPGLIAQKKALAGLIGQTMTVKASKYADAKLPKSSDYLKLKFAETDAVKVTGKLKGKSVSLSTIVVYCGREGDAASDQPDVVYTAEVAIIEPTSGYSRLATFTLTVGSDGKVGKAVSFSKIMDRTMTDPVD